MKKLFFLFAILSISSFLHAQPWSEQVSGVTVQLTSVNSVSSTVVWACGYSGTVLLTTNAGVNWINAAGTGIPNTVSLIAVVGINLTTAIVAGYTGANTWVWKTTNGGNNWIQVFTQTGGFIDAVWINPSLVTNGFMAGDPVGGRWSLWKTTNGGTNWDSTGLYLPAVGADASWNNAISVVYPKIWIGTNNTRVYYSSNYGTNWITQPTETELNGYSVWFWNDGMKGYLGGAQLWQTTNGGTNWTAVAPAVPGTGNISSLTASDMITNNPLPFISWCSRGTNTIYFYLSNAWLSEYVAAAGTYRHMSNIQYGRGIWAVRNNGGISFHPPLTGITKIEGEIPGSFSLAQNYPNPFNPMTNITYSIAGNKSVMVTLKIYDILGKEAAVPVNQIQSPGTYNLLYDASTLSTGVYFYNLTAGSYKETKKMLVVK